VLVVLDVGVLVSALITPGGTASRVIAAGLAGRFEYMLCPRLVGEFREAVERPTIARLATEEHRQRLVVLKRHEVSFFPVDGLAATAFVRTVAP
jgi:predicted nucleic acid-binding protein